MKKAGFRKRNRKLRRMEALALSVTMVVTSISFPSSTAAETVSWKNDISSTLTDVAEDMDNGQAYTEALDDLNASLDGLEGAETVDGLVVTAVGTNSVTLEWDPFASDDLVGYNIYWADKDTDTEEYAKLNADGSKAADNDSASITVGKDTTSFTYEKSSSVHHYFKVAPVLGTGEGSKTDAVKSPTAAEFHKYLENLDRGLVEVPAAGGIFLSWRLLGTEVTGYSETGLTGTDFNVYQDGVKIATVTDSTNYLVSGGSSDHKYTVVPVVDGKENVAATSAEAMQMTTGEGAAGYMDIPLQAPANTTVEDTYGISTAEVTLLNQNRTDGYTTTEIT